MNKIIVLIVIFFCQFYTFSQNKTIRVQYNKNEKQQVFGVTRLSQTLKTKGYSPILVDVEESSGNEDIYITILPSDSLIEKEGFSLLPKQSRIEIRAIDELGAMYGLLELADMIDIRGIISFLL